MKLPNANLKVKLENGHTAPDFISGKARINFNRVRSGDKLYGAVDALRSRSHLYGFSAPNNESLRNRSNSANGWLRPAPSN